MSATTEQGDKAKTKMETIEPKDRPALVTVEVIKAIVSVFKNFAAQHPRIFKLRAIKLPDDQMVYGVSISLFDLTFVEFSAGGGFVLHVNYVDFIDVDADLFGIDPRLDPVVYRSKVHLQSTVANTAAESMLNYIRLVMNNITLSTDIALVREVTSNHAAEIERLTNIALTTVLKARDAEIRKKGNEQIAIADFLGFLNDLQLDGQASEHVGIPHPTV